MRYMFAIPLIIGAIAAPLSAQLDNTRTEIPQIVVTGRGEVRVTPDRANIQISVQSRAVTAAAAAADNANKQAAVIAAIRSLGINTEQISTSNFNVSPEQKYEANQAPVIIGYVVTNTVVVEIRKITMVGAVLDAALSHGANLISGLSFYASNTESARRSAISSAVASARADAEAAAKAAGGTLGGLLEINVGSYSQPIPRPMMMRGGVAAASMQADTPISPGQKTLSVEVTTRWKFSSAN
ncbi:MAG TPA: SIMPL domain-containing protein [Thermoanaerobaculia bacterium]|nr:SIMPL domain-containing protein [Thermoanaerobaculia bacterium]